MKDWAFTVNAASKTYSMTGWRIGYMTGPQKFIKPISSLQSHSTSNPCSIAQKAALAALLGPQDCVKEMVSEFEKRRDYVHEAFNKIPGFKLGKPEGAFYAFPDISGAGKDSFELTELLMEKARIAVVPGGAFGEEGNQFIRFSFASSMADIEEGLKRIKEALI
jgi:aspartate aminotransferase